MIGIDDERTKLAAALRGLRQGTGLSTTKFAKRLGWSQSKVSKSERGVTMLEPDDVAAWATAAEAGSAQQEELVAIATRAAAQLTEWRRALAPGRRRVQEDIQRLESASSVIRVFAPAVVVGLAQTQQFAEAVFRLGTPEVSPEELPEIVDARLARQIVLNDETKRFCLLMSETALRRGLIDRSDMREQIERLIQLSERPNVAIGVIPFSAVERVHQYHGYAILGDLSVDDEAIVLAETVTRGITIRAPREIAEYIEHFEALRSAALEGEPLRAFLREVIAELS